MKAINQVVKMIADETYKNLPLEISKIDYNKRF